MGRRTPSQELGRAFLKVFKSENFPLTSFTVALLLSVARIQRFADQALETIKTAIQVSLSLRLANPPTA
jgi:hypothetical protein